MFFKEYVGEPLLKPPVSYPEMKSKYSFQVINLRYQVDHFNPKNIQLFEEYRVDPAIVRLFIVLIRHREIIMISDEMKIVSEKKLEQFMKKYNLNHQTLTTSDLKNTLAALGMINVDIYAKNSIV